MFTNLIESESHRKEFKRRSSFFLATVAAYALILFAAGVASIYAYDTRLEAQSSDLTVLNWIPPVAVTAARPPRETHPQIFHRSAQSNAPVDRNITIAERRNAIARTDDPTRVPDHPGIVAATDPPVTGPVRFSNRNVDPPNFGSNNSGNCVSCNGTAPVVRVEETGPVPTPVKPPATLRVSLGVLIAKAISLPQPPYPPLAKQIRIQGPVTVQILVDEEGRVVSAQTVSGHPTLLAAAREAALRARFTPTKLSGVAVKVQGLITYNFILQ